MATSVPTVDRFLGEVSRLVRERNGSQLQDYLAIEPPFSALYQSMITELRQHFTREQADRLEKKCSDSLPLARDGDEGAPWTAFIKFIVQYFFFIRDVNVANLLDTYNLLAELVQKANSALGHATLGVIILPTVVAYSRTLSRLAIGLDKQPELIAEFARAKSGDEGTARETLPERAANYVRQAFVTCLNDRTGAAASTGKPEGKKVGIYKLANLCLKILFQCRKTRNAEQIFTNIYNQSPPLSAYPRSERVTYLYYLGRFLFSNSHFYRSHLALQTAYQQCHAKAIRQRRLILIYLIGANIILGRFPSAALYARSEAAGLSARFQPLCKAMATGNLAAFHELLALDSPLAKWFLHYRMLMQIRNRGEVLVWRCLMRKVFVVNGSQGDVETRKAPTLDLNDVLKIMNYLEEKELLQQQKTSSTTDQPAPGQRHTNWIFMNNEATAVPVPQAYVDPDLVDAVDEAEESPIMIDMLGVECIVASLIEQGLVGGYISHKSQKLAIQGAKRKGGALAAGFPNVWSVISAKANSEVPGWRRDAVSTAARPASFGPGMVVNLSGARPAGSG